MTSAIEKMNKLMAAAKADGLANALENGTNAPIWYGAAYDGKYSVSVQPVTARCSSRRKDHCRFQFRIQVAAENWKVVNKVAFIAALQAEEAASTEPSYETHDGNCQCDDCGERVAMAMQSEE